MLQNEKINQFQFLCLVILYVIGDSIYIMPSILASEAKQDAWIAAILSMGLGLSFIFLFTAIARRYPNLTLVQYSDKILGKWLGKISSFLFITALFILAATLLREIGDFLTTQIMPRTPIQAIEILFLCIVIVGARLGVETIARSAEILAPWVFIFFIIFSVFLLPEINIKNIQPVFEDGVKPILRASYTFTATPFMESYVFLMLLPYLNRGEKAKKVLFIGTVIGGIILLVTILLSILVIGADLTTRNTFPSYALAKRINIADILTRLEAVLASIWFTTIFFKITLLFYSSAIGLAQMLKLKDYKSLLLPLGMILIVLSLIITPDIVYFNIVAKYYFPLLDLTIGICLPLLLLTIAKIRKLK